MSHVERGPAPTLPILHVMQGLPGAGKTTAARQVIADSPRPVRYVGLDGLRWLLDGQAPSEWWLPGFEESTTRAQAVLVGALLADGCDVLVDGTHVSPAQCGALRQVLAGRRLHVVVHALWTPVEVCVARDAGRAHAIGGACIRRLAREQRAAPGASQGPLCDPGSVSNALSARLSASGRLPVPGATQLPNGRLWRPCPSI